MKTNSKKVARDAENNQTSQKWETVDAVIEAENIWRL